MAKQSNVMDKFDFLLGNWNLEYKVPKSALSEAATGTGTGNNSDMFPDENQIFLELRCLNKTKQKISKSRFLLWRKI